MNTPQTTAIGIDVGGTFVRAGLVNQNGRILSFQKHPTPIEDEGQQLVSLIAQSVRNLEKEFTQLSEPHALACADNNLTEPQAIACADKNLSEPQPELIPDLSGACGSSEPRLRHNYNLPIAIALPGPLDPQRNKILRSVNLPFLQGKMIADELFRKIQRRSVLFTDAEACVWGEYAAQSPAPLRFVHLRLGTGVACGLIVDGAIQPLNRNENQHSTDLVVDHSDSAIECPCGLRGCLETIASGKALEQFARENNYNDGLINLQKCWEAGDPDVRNKFVSVAQAVHIACDNLIERYQPDVITIGGGVIDTLPGLYSMVLSSAQTITPSNSHRKTRIEPARLSDYAGATGAALLALQPHNLQSNNS